MIDYEEIAHQCHTDDGIDHGKRHLEDCLDCTIAKYEDGYIYCPLTWSGRTCEECMEIFERRMEKYTNQVGVALINGDINNAYCTIQQIYGLSHK